MVFLVAAVRFLEKNLTAFLIVDSLIDGYMLIVSTDAIVYILINYTSSLVDMPVFCTFRFYDLLHTFYPDVCFYILIHDDSSAY